MKVYIVTVEQAYANHYRVDKVFATEAEAVSYCLMKGKDYYYEAFEVEGGKA